MKLTSGRLFRAAGLGAVALALGAATLQPAASSASVQGAAGSDGDRASARHAYADAGTRAGTVKLDLLAINDFHGNLDPPGGSGGLIGATPAGGAAYLATHLNRLRAKAAHDGAHTLTVAAGDLVGASPLLSAAFHDEPTIKAMNRMGLDVSAVGNHEFDEGYRELQRLQRGGCLDDGAEGENNQNSCPGSQGFGGAQFQYLAANVIKKSTGRSILPRTWVTKVGGVKVGFIGMTLQGTPNIVTAAAVQGLRFGDEVRTANRLVPGLKDRGVQSIVVLLHEGGVTADFNAYDGCPSLTGPIVDINAGLSPEIDAVVSGHTHQPYNCTLADPAGKPRLVTSASSFGRLVSDIHLLLNKQSGDVVRPAAWDENVIVTRGVQADPEIQSLIDAYTELVAAIAGEVIGYIDGTISRTQEPDGGDSPLGNLIADSQREFAGAVAPGDTGPADIAFMNPGGIRADLVPNDDGETLTYGAAFTVQPFNNYVVSMDMTGAQIRTILEQQFSGLNEATDKVLQVSNLTYQWNETLPTGSKVIDSSVEVGGEPLVDGQTYRVVANSFLEGGGDGFAEFTNATNVFFGGLDIDALQAYLTANSSEGAPYAATPTDRIDRADIP